MNETDAQFWKRFTTDELPADWKDTIDTYFETLKGRELKEFLCLRNRDGAVIYPPDPWRALRMLSPADVRVVILGQDPYHGPGQAVGMSFSVPRSLTKLPPSLRNIFKEVARDCGGVVRKNGDLSDWAHQGVLLLNSVLTVEEGRAGSHGRHGWEELTDALLVRVLRENRPCVFLLWGAWAQKRIPLIRQYGREDEVAVLACNHPSPLSYSRGPVPFQGCSHFARCNEWLVARGLGPIIWQRPETVESMQGHLF